MNRFLVFKNEKTPAGTYQIFDRERLDHLNEVLKLRADDSLKVTLVDEGIGLGKILKLSSDNLELDLLNITPKTESPYNLIVGLSRPPTMKKVLEHGATMGVGSFEFFKAHLSEKSYLDSKLFKDDQFKKYLKLGIAQSALYHKIPQVKLSKGISDWKNTPQKFILTPNTSQTFLDFKLDFDQQITLAVGPERGWTKDEITSFKDMGFIEIGISPAILRVETAIFSSLGQLELLRIAQ